MHPNALHLPHSVLSGFQFSLTSSLRESLGRSNQRGSKTSQACYSHPRCNLILVLTSASLFFCRCLDAFSCSLTHAAINQQPPPCTVQNRTRPSRGEIRHTLHTSKKTTMVQKYSLKVTFPKKKKRKKKRKQTDVKNCV